MFCLGQMFPNRGRRSFMVFCDPVLELSSRLTYIGSRALSTLDAIDDAWFVLLGNLVLGSHQVRADVVVGLQVDCNACLPDGSG